MSDYETRIGTLRKTELSVDEVVYNWLKENEKPKYYTLPKDNLELFRDELYGKYIVLNDIVFEIINDKELWDDDIYELTKNKDGTYSYILRYYNGGCDFDEALETAYENIKEEVKKEPLEPIGFNQLKGIIETWKETGYPDSPGAYGCMTTLKRVYEGRYDIEAAEYLTDLIFNKEK